MAFTSMKDAGAHRNSAEYRTTGTPDRRAKVKAGECLTHEPCGW